MPELPEVETVVRTLKKQIKGKTFKKATFRYSKILKTDTEQVFKKKIQGQKINDIKRAGKHIIFVLDDYALISHLRMEGKYYIFENEADVCIGREHVMVEFEMTDGTLVFYHDTRRFGTMHLLPIDEYMNLDPLNKLGPEPWDPICTPEYLFDKIKNKRTAIKTVLLDQTIMAGLGNIYVDEVLFDCKINPTTPACNITKKQAGQLVDSSIKIMEFAISLGGTSINSYTSSLGVTGRFQNELKVHTMKGKECPRCKTIISKSKVNGRGTYTCDKCQK